MVQGSGLLNRGGIIAARGFESHTLRHKINMKNYKLVVTVPETHADLVREALGKAGAGKAGNYDFCSFTSRGVGRFRPNDEANPTIGEAGKFEEVTEERIEVSCDEGNLKHVVSELRKVHPYEEPVIDIYPLEES